MQHDRGAGVGRHPSLGRALPLPVPGMEGDPQEFVEGATPFEVRDDEVDLNDGDHDHSIDTKRSAQPPELGRSGPRRTRTNLTKPPRNARTILVVLGTEVGAQSVFLRRDL